MADATEAKRAVRQQFRHQRRDLPDQPERSNQICRRLAASIDSSQQRTVMVYEAVPGEPDIGSFVEWCRAEGIVVVWPAPARDAAYPVDPSEVDVVVVPGLAFTADGDRLGQGGGWYDRFLALVDQRCVRIGVCFAEQIVAELPIEPHDARLDLVVSDGNTAPSAISN